MSLKHTLDRIFQPRVDEAQRWFDNQHRLHRDNDQPAFIANGNLSWYRHGLEHRDNDLPSFVGEDGRRTWRHMGNPHRGEDLPACITPTKSEWWINGQKHRDNNQPAIVYSDGAMEWWIEGERVKVNYSRGYRDHRGVYVHDNIGTIIHLI